MIKEVISLASENKESPPGSLGSCSSNRTKDSTDSGDKAPRSGPRGEIAMGKIMRKMHLPIVLE